MKKFIINEDLKKALISQLGEYPAKEVMNFILALNQLEEFKEE